MNEDLLYIIEALQNPITYINLRTLYSDWQELADNGNGIAQKVIDNLTQFTNIVKAAEAM